MKLRNKNMCLIVDFYYRNWLFLLIFELLFGKWSFLLKITC